VHLLSVGKGFINVQPTHDNNNFKNMVVGTCMLSAYPECTTFILICCKSRVCSPIDLSIRLRSSSIKCRDSTSELRLVKLTSDPM